VPGCGQNAFGVIEMHVAEDHVLDVGRLHADLTELSVDREIGVNALVEHGRQGAPVGLVGKKLVVVSRLKQHIAFGVLD
jgi:hypothetical protein